MPTEQLKLFWNRAHPEFTFMDLKNQNPIGQWQTFSTEFGEMLMDPASFGAVYNVQDISPQQATANFAAIQAAIAALPDSGGFLLITGHLQYIGTIKNPMRPFVPQTDGRPIPFDIVGFPGSALIQLGAGLPAVDLECVFSFQVGSTSAPVRAKDIQIYSKGPGVITRNGGKETQLLNTRISACVGTGLDIKNFDGGRIHDIYAIFNRGDGCHIDQCHMADIVLTTRNNAGVGAKITNSAALRLWLYTESNAGLGLIFDAVKYCEIMLWEENNNGSSYGVQGRVTNSPHNTYYGIAQDEANRAWDIDDLSACTSTFNGKPMRDITPKKLALAWPPVEGNIHGPFHTPAGYVPKSKVVGNEVQIQIPVGFYSMQTIENNWIELYSDGWYPPLMQNFVQGDNVLVRAKFKVDAAMAAFFAQHTTTETVKFVMQSNNGKLDIGSQTANMRTTDEFAVEFWSPVIASGQDTVRFFMYICPAIFGSPTDLQPPIPHLFTMTGIEFFLLKGLPPAL